jgi:hypothetical protein
MVSDVEHLFINLFSICIDSSEQYLFGSIAHFLIGWIATDLFEFLAYFGY